MARTSARRISNPPNPYLSRHCELLGEPPRAELEIFEDRTKSILSRNDSPDLDFRWSVNPYRGCFHACAYCYARTTHEYFGLGAGTDFERKIFVKPEAPRLLAEALQKESWRGELIAFSGATDCYQPLEASWELTRGCLEVCRDERNPVGIVTKSRLIRRDVELLAELHRVAGVFVAISIPFRDEEMARKIEPGAPSIGRRFETMRILADAGIPVSIMVAPLIPGLNDADLPELLREARRNGARSASRVLLRLSGSVREVFLERLREELPDRADRVEARIREVRGGKLSDSRFWKRGRGGGNYWEMIDRVWKLWTTRLGLTHRVEPRPGRARRRRRQLELW